jgi:hypothetical protein
MEGDLRLPWLFRQVHGDKIFSTWMRNDKSPFMNIIPREPLGRVLVDFPGDALPDGTVTIVTVRCWNDRGVMQYEAASPADLKVAQDWCDRYRLGLVEVA